MPRRTTTRSPADATETPCLIVRHGCMLVQLAVLLPPGATNSVAADAHAGAAPSATAAIARQPASRTPRRTLFESFDIPNLRFMPSHAKGLGAANAASLLPPVAEVNRQRESAPSISHLGSFSIASAAASYSLDGCPGTQAPTTGRPTCR